MKTIPAPVCLRRAVLALVSLLALSLAPSVMGADDDEIDRTVWEPFTQSFAACDAAAFNQLHSKDLVRAERDRGMVMDFEEYCRFNEQMFQRARDAQAKQVLELRFTERLRNGNLAYEVGIYRTTIVVGGETHEYFGRFHVVLRKEEGVWKILVDSDSSEGGTVGAKDFSEANLQSAAG